ncbi:hypothetical protein V8G54_018607 [Vigna mungo]|uniref:Uncharacterized protein n=1 Tax=Vigna mungo TaxID=3915 RepID=A0AAQ3N9I5_VIGMU
MCNLSCGGFTTSSAFSVPTRQQGNNSNVVNCLLRFHQLPPINILDLSLSASLLIHNGFGVVLLAYHLFPFPHRFFSLNVLPGIHLTFPFLSISNFFLCLSSVI